MSLDSLKTKSVLTVGNQEVEYFQIDPNLRLPFTIKILLENLLRNEDNLTVTKKDIEAVLAWEPKGKRQEIAFRTARVLLQDFTGVPAVVDLATMREAIQDLGGDPNKINPLQQADLVIDHSVQVDYFGSKDAFEKNRQLEYERNQERYTFLRWGQQAFKDFSVVPPETGIVHQVNLEYLAKVIFTKEVNGKILAYPDTLVGTDSHTTMINGLGVVGWGVGGIEAEASMLGQPITMLIPDVIGFKLTGSLPEGATATDLVLTVVEMLRKKGVVEKFVEFYGSGLSSLSLPDKATLANMAPEYGATVGFFPVDQSTLDYLKLTGRSQDQIDLVQAYCKQQGLFRTDETPDPVFTDTLELDLASVVPSISGPKRPQDRIPLKESKQSFEKALNDLANGSDLKASAKVDDYELHQGSVVIAAITSCTNTSNPAVMLGAGLVARKAVQKGLTVKPWVKTSLAPGSKVVMDYLEKAGVLNDLEKLKFNLVGFGCTTCIGNSGPLPEAIASAIKENQLVATSVLSGNRNFEGRINPNVKANYLASPPLVVAYAIAGRMDIDLYNEPLGQDTEGNNVFLKDIWPTNKEIQAILGSVTEEQFSKEYAEVFAGDAAWQALKIPAGSTFEWNEDSTYIKKPPFFENLKATPNSLSNIEKARVLALLGDSVTTDHISPAGAIPEESPTSEYLKSKGVERKDFNSYGSRRGNHEVMMRGTFGNIRIKNQLVPGTEGGYTKHFPEGEKCFIYDAAMKYKEENVPLIVIAGKEYGTGSSRDWAAKGTHLLGVKAVIAESYERIHRSNLVGMGVLPLQFKPGEGAPSLGLTGEETFTIEGITDLTTGSILKVKVDGSDKSFEAITRIDTPQELEYYRHGGILSYVLRQLL